MNLSVLKRHLTQTGELRKAYYYQICLVREQKPNQKIILKQKNLKKIEGFIVRLTNKAIF